MLRKLPLQFIALTLLMKWNQSKPSFHSTELVSWQTSNKLNNPVTSAVSICMTDTKMQQLHQQIANLSFLLWVIGYFCRTAALSTQMCVCFSAYMCIVERVLILHQRTINTGWSKAETKSSCWLCITLLVSHVASSVIFLALVICIQLLLSG